MKAFALLLIVVTGAACSTGCATPAYSAHERAQLISRTWGIEEKQMNDDIDEFLLLRPPSRGSIWHTR